MKTPESPLLLVPFREVRHFQPDDCLHYEPISIRAHELDWTIPAHRHEGLHQFQYLEKGRISGTIDGRPFEVRAPALIMLAPGSVHGFSYTPHAVGHQVTIPSATLRQLLGGSQLVDSELGASFVVPPGRDAEPEWKSLFQRIAAEFQAQHAGRAHALLASATLLAVEYLRRRGELVSQERRPGARDTLVQRYQSLLEQHYREHHPLAWYAEQLGVTADHLSRTCRAVCGLSAQQVLHDRLMLEARRLLAYTPMPVARVAEHLGYADTAYFSKFFARSVGQTPSQYRGAVAKGVRQDA
ncbi:helix-turn-helix domain-containing protein [Ramlibacter sp. AW1]|uniref:Helix-turn-helix domain-containing protein n=1 Tax=Ramlibacter aurantiacus TaxID=2801330 RepID=A0A936ZLU4_9BURK|nr:AraC family transcriptional regulator [Ramlibacter aurantiacus]MBL0420061.1 helix-turn-helix domain-containing protein [Ramlibacter aurantiacus]